MTTPIEQRWATPPPPELPLRTVLLRWTTVEREAVYAFIGRQFTPELKAWVDRRTADYLEQWPNDKELRLWHEAAADLIAWQRHMTADKILLWVVEWEGVNEGKREKEKGKEQ